MLAAPPSSSFVATRREPNTTMGLAALPGLQPVSSSTPTVDIPIPHHVAALASTSFPRGAMIVAAGHARLTLLTVRRNEDNDIPNRWAPPTSTRSTPPLALSLSQPLEISLDGHITCASAVVAAPFSVSASNTTGRTAKQHLSLVVVGSEQGTFCVFEVSAPPMAPPAWMVAEAALVCDGDLSLVTPESAPVTTELVATLLPHERRVVAAAVAWCAAIGTSWVALATPTKVFVFDTITLGNATWRTALAVIDYASAPGFHGSHGGAKIVNISPLLRNTAADSSGDVSRWSSSDAEEDISVAATAPDASIEEAAFSVVWDDGTVHTIVALIGEVHSGRQHVSFHACRHLCPDDQQGMFVCAAASVAARRSNASRKNALLRTVLASTEGAIAVASYDSSLSLGNIDPFVGGGASTQVGTVSTQRSVSRLCVADQCTSLRLPDRPLVALAGGTELSTVTWEQASNNGAAIAVQAPRSLTAYATPITALMILPALPGTNHSDRATKGTATPSSARGSQAPSASLLSRQGRTDGPVVVVAADGGLHFVFP